MEKKQTDFEDKCIANFLYEMTLVYRTIQF